MTDETAMKHDAIRRRLAEADDRHWFAYETPQIRSLLRDRDALEQERDVWKAKAETRGREGCEARADRDALARRLAEAEQARDRYAQVIADAADHLGCPVGGVVAAARDTVGRMADAEGLLRMSRDMWVEDCSGTAERIDAFLAKRESGAARCPHTQWGDAGHGDMRCLACGARMQGVGSAR